MDAARTGRGKLVVRGKTHVEEGKRGKTAVVITEIPYMVNKTLLIETIVQAVQEKHIDGVSDIRDESDRDGMRIVLDLSREGDPNLVLRQLYRRTQLQSTFGVINLALVGGKPCVLPMMDLLRIYLDHRRDVVRRRTTFRLDKAKAREHIVEGLVKALDMIDRVIALIRASSTTQDARDALVNELGFSPVQAQSILELRLQRLTGLEREKLEEELKQLLADIEYFTSILENPKLLDAVIRDELSDVGRRFGDDRKTQIMEAEREMADEDLIPETDIVVVLSKDGFLRRKSLEEYSLQGRGGKGRKGASVPEEDEIMILAVTNTHKDIFLFTSKGRVLAVKGYMIPESKNGKGRHVSKFVSIEENERVVSMYGRGVEDSKYIFLITRNGTAKRLEISELASLTRAGKRVLSLDEGDEIAKVRLTSGSDDLLLMTESGQALRVPEVEFRSMGRSARGVRAMRLDPGDCVIGCDIVHPAKTSLIISQRGVGKRTEYDDFTTHHRGGGGVRAMNLGRKTGVLVGCWGVSDDDEVIAITNRGRMIRVAASEIPLLSRGATGSITVRLDEGDMVADVSVVPGDVSREAVPAPQVRDVETPLLAEEEE